MIRASNTITIFIRLRLLIALFTGVTFTRDPSSYRDAVGHRLSLSQNNVPDAVAYILRKKLNTVYIRRLCDNTVPDGHPVGDGDFADLLQRRGEFAHNDGQFSNRRSQLFGRYFRLLQALQYSALVIARVTVFVSSLP